MAKLGFLINPIAGMGGAVGLKGTDGQKTLGEAVRRGAKPVALERGARFLKEVKRRDKGLELVVAPGAMGEDLANMIDLHYESIGRIGKTTTSRDTVRIVHLMRRKKVNLIVFCGGDGTARDFLEGVSSETPVLGVPAGVKIFSSVFSINPTAAAETATAFLAGSISTKLGEVVDVDESAYRKNLLSVKLFGHLVIPDSGSLMQGLKSPSYTEENIDLDSGAEYIVEEMIPDVAYVLGPGSTVERIASRLKVKKTLLGVDVVRGDGTLLGRDMDEKALLKIVNKSPAKIIVSPIGGQGFLFGRGNQQISPAVIRSVGVENMVIVAARSKIEALHPRRLLVDSGDEEVDQKLRGYARVITAYKEEVVIKVE